jgi:signal transduction histidine kinase
MYQNKKIQNHYIYDKFYRNDRLQTLPPDGFESVGDYAGVDHITGYVVSESVNLRIGPGVKYEILYSLPFGAEVNIVEKGDWYKIIFDNKILYVASAYISLGDVVPTPTPEPQDEFWEQKEEHLFSKSGTEYHTTEYFSDIQSYDSIYNLKEIDRLYVTEVISRTKTKSGESYGVEEGYVIKAVINTRMLLKRYSIMNVFLIMFIGIVIFFIIGFLIFSIYGAYKTRRYLKPISDITKLTSEIQPNSTYRIDVDTAKYELKELVITINDMLDRLNAAHVKRRKFVSDVSHELRTPISVITGYANMLKRWAKDDEAVFDESVDAIIEESENMKYLVENLLFLARCDNDQLTYDKEPFDVSSLIEDIYKDAKMVDSNKHDLSGDITQGVIINGDRNRIKQAIREFVQNAIKYNPPTGKIKKLLQKHDDKAIINITDTGIGISKKDMGHIFTRFYRGDISRNRDNGGYGLGMSIAREIVSSHGGKIKIKSKEGEGTSVIVEFRLA